MDIVEWFMVSGLILTWVVAIWWGRIQQHRQTRLECHWDEFKIERRELYAKLADPERIEADLEASAQRREMHDANRKTLPREDSGSPAKVYRPNLRGQKPGSWRPRNPGSPSEQ